jgi:hypothetical protein
MIMYVGIRDSSGFNMIELITASVLVFSSLYGGGTTTTASGADMVSTTTAPGVTARIEEQATTSLSVSQKELEKKVKTYFKDDPILVDIARCESSFRQVDENGKILRGKVNKGDVGIMQINEYYHADKAKSLGLNLRTLDGNLAYAKYLYEQQGTQPWISSSKCWNTDSGDQVALNK